MISMFYSEQNIGLYAIGHSLHSAIVYTHTQLEKEGYSVCYMTLKRNQQLQFLFLFSFCMIISEPLPFITWPFNQSKDSELTLAF